MFQESDSLAVFSELLRYTSVRELSLCNARLHLAVHEGPLARLGRRDDAGAELLRAAPPPACPAIVFLRLAGFQVSNPGWKVSSCPTFSSFDYRDESHQRGESSSSLCASNTPREANWTVLSKCSTYLRRLVKRLFQFHSQRESFEDLTDKYSRSGCGVTMRHEKSCRRIEFPKDSRRTRRIRDTPLQFSNRSIRNSRPTMIRLRFATSGHPNRDR